MAFSNQVQHRFTGFEENFDLPAFSVVVLISSTILFHIIHQFIKVTFIQRILYNSVFFKFAFCKFLCNSCCYFSFILKYIRIIKSKKCVKLCFPIFHSHRNMSSCLSCCIIKIHCHNLI